MQPAQETPSPNESLALAMAHFLPLAVAVLFSLIVAPRFAMLYAEMDYALTDLSLACVRASEAVRSLWFLVLPLGAMAFAGDAMLCNRWGAAGSRRTLLAWNVLLLALAFGAALLFAVGMFLPYVRMLTAGG